MIQQHSLIMLLLNKFLIKKKYIFFSLLSLFFIGCGNMKLNDFVKKIIVYEKGQTKIINNSFNIDECFNNIPEQYSLFVLSDKFDEIKKSEMAVEILFTNEIKYKIMPIGKEKTFSKAIIPLSGKYKKILFLGNKNGYGAYTPYGQVNCTLTNTFE